MTLLYSRKASCIAQSAFIYALYSSALLSFPSTLSLFTQSRVPVHEIYMLKYTPAG